MANASTPPSLSPLSLFSGQFGLPLIVAHRGGSLEAPENTLQALATCRARGAAWAEVDVGLSRDGVPIVLHDDTFERTCQVPLALADAYAADVRRLRAHRPQFHAETVAAIERAGGGAVPAFVDADADPAIGVQPPTLQEALAGTDVHLMVELKAGSPPAALCQAIRADLAATGAEGRVALASFDHDLLAAAEHILPSVPRIGVAEHVADARLMLQRDVAALAIACEQAAEIWPSVPPHVALWAWTVYSGPQAEQMRRVPVDGLITDAPRAVATFLRQI